MQGVVAVEEGMLRGAREGTLWVFRGVPFAASTEGGGRWRRPGPPDAWKGVREALHWGETAPQNPPTPGLSIPGDPQRSGEDCLSLNIWTPGLDDRRRPVLVWIHPGGFTTGSGSSALFAGDRLASRGDVVVVTVNYRLGALGFLAHPGLTPQGGSGCGNWGLHDQLRALEWLNRNVGSFGGDPANVTLFGQSAGAMSICSHLASRSCGRLFHKAVLQSGPPATSSVEWATRRAERIAQLLGLPIPFDRARLESVEAHSLVRATHLLAQEVPDEGGLPLPLLPVVDGEVLTRPPYEAIADGSAAGVPLLVGTTRDEAALYLALESAARPLDLGAVVRRVGKLTSEGAARSLVEQYREAREARGEACEPSDVLTAVISDYVFRLPSLGLAAAAQRYQPETFAYLFTWESPFLGGIFGSAHGLDVPFVFGTVHNDLVGNFSGSGPEAFALSEKMQQSWIAFARTGNPSCEAVGDWPSYDPVGRPTMILGAECGIEDDTRCHERLAWEQAGVEVGAGHHHELRGSCPREVRAGA